MKTNEGKIKLNFGKRNIIELNNTNLKSVRGGGTTFSNITTITDFSKNTLCTSDIK